MIGPITYLDVTLLIVAFISGLLAMYRGFTREILSILSWIIAAISVVYFVLKQKGLSEDLANRLGTQVTIAQIGLGIVLFLVVLIVVHLITSRISDFILDSSIGIIDRILGFLFGIVRGFILVLIPFMFYETFIPDPTKQLPWIRDAKSQPYLKEFGTYFKSSIETYFPSTFINPGSPRSTQPSQEQQG